MQEKLDELRKQHKAGLLAQRTKQYTLNTYLDEWLEQKTLEVKPRTVEIYRGELKHARAVLGKKRLETIKPADVQRIMRAINGEKVTHTYYKSNTGKEHKRTITLTAHAANECKNILSNAFDDAMTLGLVASNPARPVKALRH